MSGMTARIVAGSRPAARQCCARSERAVGSRLLSKVRIASSLAIASFSRTQESIRTSRSPSLSGVRKRPWLVQVDRSSAPRLRAPTSHARSFGVGGGPLSRSEQSGAGGLGAPGGPRTGPSVRVGRGASRRKPKRTSAFASHPPPPTPATHTLPPTLGRLRNPTCNLYIARGARTPSNPSPCCSVFRTASINANRAPLSASSPSTNTRRLRS
jgi:hypothetical protein